MVSWLFASRRSGGLGWILNAASSLFCSSMAIGIVFA